MACVVSRLLYNVHCWDNITQWAHDRLNIVYMRGLRRISGQHQPKAGRMSDKQILLYLDVPELAVLIRQNRLKLAGQVMRSPSDDLRAILSTLLDSQQLPWAALVRRDLIWMFEQLPSKLGELGHPGDASSSWKWVDLMKSYPQYWKLMVDLLKHASLHVRKTSAPTETIQHAHACAHCCGTFKSWRALAQHQRKKHPDVETSE